MCSNKVDALKGLHIYRLLNRFLLDGCRKNPANVLALGSLGYTQHSPCCLGGIALHATKGSAATGLLSLEPGRAKEAE